MTTDKQSEAATPRNKTMRSLSELCMDVEVTKVGEENGEDIFRVWFIAIAGGQGPRFIIPRSIALNLQGKLSAALGIPLLGPTFTAPLADVKPNTSPDFLERLLTDTSEQAARNARRIAEDHVEGQVAEDRAQEAAESDIEETECQHGQ